MYDYVLCDVFTDQPFAGNPLAVLPDARGLDDGAMQCIAAEFNLSETAFVLPGEPPRVRIFTPRGELPFAGHPTIGTAAVLAARGELAGKDRPGRATLDEAAGRVPLELEYDARGAPALIRLEAPATPRAGPPLGEAAAIASALGLEVEDLHPEWPSGTWSCGVPFACVALAGAAALGRVRVDPAAAAALPPEWSDKLYVIAPGADARALRARMFAPALGIAEDPATGAAASALAGLLAGVTGPGRHQWCIDQGVEMGRPSRLELDYEATGAAVTRVRLGGRAVIVGDGRIRPPGDAGR